MIWTRKKFSYTGTDINSYIEDSIGYNPGIEFSDANGNTFQVILVDFNPNLNQKKFEIRFHTYIKALGRTTWSFDSEETAVSDLYHWLDSNGNDTIEGAIGAIASSDFFVMNIGWNVNNVPLSLFEFFIKTIVQRKGLTYDR